MNKSRLIWLVPLALLVVYLFWEPGADEAEEQELLTERDGTSRTIPGGEREVVDVREFGAVGDGTTDDTSAFTAAVNALPPDGGTVVIPSGTYALQNWTISKDGVVVQGAGSGYAASGFGTRLRPVNVAVASDEVFKISGIATFGVIVRDVCFDNVAQDVSSKCDALVASNGTGCRFENCRFAGTTRGGLLFSNKVDAKDADSTDAGGFFGCSFYSGGIQIASAHTRVENCYFNGNGTATAITVQGITAGIGTIGTVIAFNRIETYTGATNGVIALGPVGPAGLYATAIVYNDISLSVGGTGFGILVAQNIQGLTIIGNNISELAAATRGLRIVDADGAVVKSNRFSGQAVAIELSTANGGGPNNGVDVSANRDARVLFNTYESDNFVLTGGRDDGVLRLDNVKAQTTDATPTTIYSYTLAANEAAQVNATILGRSTNGDPNAYVRVATFRHNAGVAALVGSVTAVHTAEHTGGWDATLDVSGDNFRVRVSGAAGQTVDWRLDMEIRRR